MNPLNFSAFEKGAPIFASMGESWNRLKNAGIRDKVLAAITVFGGGAMIIGLNVALLTMPAEKQDVNMGVVIVFFGLLDLAAIFLVLGGMYNFGRRALILKKFAADNGFTFTPAPTDWELPGIIFRLGRRNIYRNVVSGYTGNTIPFALFDYRYIVGRGDKSGAQIFTVFTLRLRKTYPPIILANRSGRLKWTIPSETHAEIALPEGASSFKAYGGVGTNLALVQDLITTIQAEELAKSCPGVDIEVVGTDVFIYLKNTAKKPEVMAALFSKAQTL